MKKIIALLCVICIQPLIALAQPSIEIDSAYIRELPPAVTNSAVYMSLINHGSHNVSLLGISSEAADSIMIHRSVMENGMMSMEHIMALEIPAGETVRLEPGGVHIMLTGVKRPLRAGDSVRLNLNFSNGLVLTVTAPVSRQH